MSKTRYIWLVPLIIILVIIFILSNQNGDTSISLSEWLAGRLELWKWGVLGDNGLMSTEPLILGLSLRKIAHVTAYVIVSICMYGLTRRYGITMALCYIAAVLDEIHQVFVGGRNGMFTDTLVDGVGIIIGCAVWAVVSKIVRVKRNEEI